MRRREPVLGIGIQAARKVRSAIGYVHPTELEIEVLAYMRGALVRTAPAHGSRANLLRVGERGIIAVAETLTDTERRWAIAHELGHFEAHAGISFLGLCSSTDMLPAYQASGREPEANAFAAELLMPEDLFAKRCDVATVSWEPVHALAEEFDVSLTAAALRFISYTEERVALVCAKGGKVLWSAGTKDFGTRPRRGDRIGEWTEMYSFFKKGRVSSKPQTVSASAWIEDIEDDEEHIVEHVFPAPRLGIATSLLWWKP